MLANLTNTPLASDIIRRGDTHLLRALMQRSMEQGMRTFDHSVYELYSQGEISYNEAMQSAESPNEVRLMVKLGKGVDPDKLAAEMDQLGLHPHDDELPITEIKKNSVN